MKDRAKGTDRIDWRSERDRVDLAEVATRLLGPAPGRRGERGRRLWWSCPFHEDGNPSFCVDPGKPFWRCFGCGEHGDAATLVMRHEGSSFPEAVSYLTGGPVPSGKARPRPNPSPRHEASRPPAGPSGMPEDAALSLVVASAARLWALDGADALRALTSVRGLTFGTIRDARLGWTPGVRLTTKDGRSFTARGVVIPWFDRDRLALVKIRQPEGSKPKYAEAFRDRPSLFPGRQSIRPGGPLIVVEGELDALLIGQETAEMAAVVTLGSASGRPDHDILVSMRPAAPWFIATDADAAGDRAAAGWPARARRVRPPAPFKDWTEAGQAGVSLARWWSDRLGGNVSPSLFSWPELAGMRWSSAPDPEPGIIIDQPDPDRRQLALETLADDPEGRAEIVAVQGEIQVQDVNTSYCAPSRQYATM